MVLLRSNASSGVPLVADVADAADAAEPLVADVEADVAEVEADEEARLGTNLRMDTSRIFAFKDCDNFGDPTHLLGVMLSAVRTPSGRPLQELSPL